MALQNINPTQTQAWKNLENHFESMKNNGIKEMFQKDSNRATQFHIQWNDFLVDFSKNNITSETMRLLTNLANEAQLKDAISK